VAVSALKFAKAMQQFALHGVNFGCGLLDQKLRALVQQEAPQVISLVDRLSHARVHRIVRCRSQGASSAALSAGR
jgi:hypothetical protein